LANHRSAIKRNRQNVTRRAHNRHFMTMVRNSVKLFCASLEEGDVTAAQDAFRYAERTIRRVAGKGLLHKRTADRKVSRLSRALNNYRASQD
jgi:small subunit ribosomal protein S20